MNKLEINDVRLKDHFTQLSSIGALPSGGYHRPAFSEADIQAREWLENKIVSAGLDYQMDGAGNQFGALGREDGLEPSILLGSHLDTVTHGGSYDGALGVLAALEVLETVRDAGVQLQYRLGLVNFSDEEGTHAGLLGSRAFCGLLNVEDLQQPNSGSEVFEKGIRRIGITLNSILAVSSKSFLPTVYLELHIEQGPILEKKSIRIGVVTSVVGIRTRKILFKGTAAHSGTTPMNLRRDAGYGACSFAKAARELVLAKFPKAVVNIGNLSIEPGSFNIVPGQAEVLLEFRSQSIREADEMEMMLRALAENIAASEKLRLNILESANIQPVGLSQKAQSAVATAADDLHLSSLMMLSGAGHDAQSMSRICSSGMVFIPSVGGISHSPKEFSKWEDCINGANVLLHSAMKSASP